MTDQPDLRQRLADAIRAAAHACDGKCGLTEEECAKANRILVSAWTFGVVSCVEGEVDDPAAVAEAVVQPKLDALRAEVKHAQADRHRAWKVHRAMVEQLAKDQGRVDRVRAMHRPSASGQDCEACWDHTGNPQPWPCPTARALDDPAAPAESPQCRAGQNAELCPPGAHPDLPYPWICPGPPTAEQPVGDECPRCNRDTAACRCDLGTPAEQLDEDDVYQPDPPIRCGIVTVADTPVRVTGGRQLTDLDRKHLAEVIRAAKRLYAAEHPEAVEVPAQQPAMPTDQADATQTSDQAATDGDGCQSSVHGACVRTLAEPPCESCVAPAAR